jgi:hypothetical protein
MRDPGYLLVLNRKEATGVPGLQRTTAGSLSRKRDRLRVLRCARDTRCGQLPEPTSASGKNISRQAAGGLRSAPVLAMKATNGPMPPTLVL